MMKFLISKNSNKKSNGFTMIELIIAMAAFIIVVSVIFTLFMSSLRGHRRALAVQNVQDTARFLLGFITKEVRMSDIEFIDLYNLDITRPDGEDITYSFNSLNKSIERIDPSGLGGAMNSDEISVTGSFYSSGVGCGDSEHPRITIVLKVETKTGEHAEISIQSTISPRNFERDATGAICI